MRSTLKILLRRHGRDAHLEIRASGELELCGASNAPRGDFDLLRDVHSKWQRLVASKGSALVATLTALQIDSNKEI